MARRFSTPTFSMRPGSSYLTTSPPPQRFSMAQVIGASTVIVLPCTSTTTRSHSMLNGCQRPPGVSPFMPTASIHAWLPMRRTMHRVAGLEAARRCDPEAAGADRHVLVEHRLLRLVSRHRAGRAGDADERGGAAAEAADRRGPARRRGRRHRQARRHGLRRADRPGCGNRGGRPGGTAGRDGRPARAGADEDGPGVAHAFAAQHDAAGLDPAAASPSGSSRPAAARRRGSRSGRAAAPTPCRWRACMCRGVVPGDRPDRLLHRHRGNRHAAAAIPGMRGVVDDVALFVGHVDEPAVGARIDARHGRRQVLHLQVLASQERRAAAICRILRRDRSVLIASRE